jgi:hypothetical protein
MMGPSAQALSEDERLLQRYLDGDIHLTASSQDPT